MKSAGNRFEFLLTAWLRALVATSFGIAVIDNEDQEVIDKILRHLGLYPTSQRPPPKPKALELQIDYSDSQLPYYEDQDLKLPSVGTGSFHAR
jgi:hypothetical protein